MAVTNLTGYTFEFVTDSDFYFPPTGATFNLNFTSHTESFTSLTYYNYSMDDYTSLGRGDAGMRYGSSNVWDEYDEWSDRNYYTLVITGGVDATNPEVIAWFQANGTLTPPPSPSIADKLLAVNQIKQDIKSAIEDKDIDMTDVEFSGYAEKIDELSSVVELTQAQYDALPFVWKDTWNTVTVPSDAGIANLAAPYNTISGLHIFATKQEALSFNPSSSGLKALVTGYKWIPSNSSEYDNAGHKIDKSGNFDGSPSEGDANYLLIPSYNLWDYGQWSVVMRIENIGLGHSYWKLAKVGTTYEGSPKVYESTIYDDNTYYLIVEIQSRYVQTTTADFDSNGDYTGTEEYIILPADKPGGYSINNINVKGVATNGDYLTNASQMFRQNNSLYLELNYLNTSNVTDMNYMFFNTKVTTLDLSSFDTSNVTSMSFMFGGVKATTLDLSSFDTSNVTDMSFMFNGAQATTGYARTQTDADNFNNSSNKPSTLTFVVK